MRKLRIVFLTLFSVLMLFTYSFGEKTKLNILQQPFSGNITYLSKTTGDVLLDESFEDYQGGWSVIDNDGDGKQWALYTEQPPGDTLAHTGIKGAGCEYNAAGNDDYFITPQLAIPSTGTTTFSFWARSHSATYPEAFNVKLSTTDIAAGDFNVLLQSVPEASAEWVQYSYDLSSYGGQNVYLALNCVSVDKWYLWADDFKCEVETGGVEAPDVMSVSYGPPASANTWEKFTIALTATTFGVSEAEFSAAMQQISMIRIATEMHNGADIGSLDDVKLGNLYTSNFNSNTEEWSASGDGTMSWSSSGGVSGGNLTISDWATGELHFAVAPASWAGNLSSLIGQNLEFYYKTNQPSYSAVIEFYTTDANRVILGSEKMTLTPGLTTQMKVSLVPKPASNTVVNLSSSNSSVISLPSTVTVGTSGYAMVDVTAGNVTEESSAVITASTSGYTTSRLTYTVSAGGSATLKGQVTNALNGEPIEGATVQVAGLSDITDNNGNYEIENVPPGELNANFYGLPTSGTAPLAVNFYDNSASDAHTVDASAEGFSSYSNSQVIVDAGSSITLDISLSPFLTAGKVRLVLNWDDDPEDVDSHLYTPDIGGYTHHIYWSSQGDEDSAPYATLDHDDTDGYGPETTTIHEFYPGKYSYWIYKYSGNQDLSQSNSVVQIYGENGLLRTLNVPTSGSQEWWHVCDIDGATQTVTIVNQLKNDVDSALPKAIKDKPETAPILSKVTNPVSSWLWDFGDGSTSSVQNPSYTYTNEGSYTVTLTVSDGGSSKTVTKSNYIIVQNTIAGLVAHYPFTDNANDVSGNGYHGEVYGPAISTDRYNNFYSAYLFDGVDDRIKIPYEVVNGLDDFSIIYWIKNIQTSGDKYILTAVDPGGSNELLLGIEGGNPVSYLEDNSHSYAKNVADGIWHQIVYTRSGSSLKCYVDGVLIDEDTNVPTSTINIPQNALWLGGDQDAVGGSWDSSQQFAGYLDDIKIYNVMLTANQVQNIYTIGSVAIEDEVLEVIPETYKLSQNYPNPFNPSTNIQYSITKSIDVKLTIYDLAGNAVEELVNKHQNAGTYIVSWDAGNNPSGIYIIRMETPDFMTSQKMMFMK